MARITEPEIIDFPGTPTVVVRREQLPVTQMREFMDSTFAALGAAMQQGRFAPAGPAFSRYDSEWGETVTVEAGFPVDEPLPGSIEGEGATIIPSGLPSCRLAITKYTGPYEGLPDAWADFADRLASRGLELGMPVWEAYDTQPTPDTDPATLITGLAVPVTEPAE